MTIMIGKYRSIFVVLLLAAIVLALYWPVVGYDFIALDDNLYVLENQHVQKGITGKNLIWAMTTFDAANWHPLTWLSLIADYELYGLNAAGYHVTNLFLHILNTIVLFLGLRWMTGEIWKCLVVAVLFAVHPLNIESVAWIAERKNLLSTLFWILTIIAYVRYAEKPGWKRYGQVFLCFTLGLMAKPILVMLPFVLLLLDYWPLQRFSAPGRDRLEGIQECQKRRKPLISLPMEKVPLIFASLLSAFVTFYAARTGGAVKAISVFPLIGRIENAFNSYAIYLVQMVWPVDLAIFYPYPAGRPFWQVALSILFLAAVTGVVLLKRRKFGYLITGWFWYLITLLPVIGIVQVGFQSMANRYAYLSLVGIFIIIAWGFPDLLKRYSSRWYLLAVAGGLLILDLAVCTRMELPHWRNSEAAFTQALRVTENNHIAQMGMGNVWLGRGDLGRARYHYQESLRIKTDYAQAHNNLALILMQEGKANEAAAHYQEALKDDPGFAEAHNNLAVVFAGQGKLREAENGFRRALELKPDYAVAQSNLAKLLLEQGKVKEAIGQFRAALAINPNNAGMKKDLEDVLKQIPALQNGRLKGR